MVRKHNFIAVVSAFNYFSVHVTLTQTIKKLNLKASCYNWVYIGFIFLFLKVLVFKYPSVLTAFGFNINEISIKFRIVPSIWSYYSHWLLLPVLCTK